MNKSYYIVLGLDLGVGSIGWCLVKKDLKGKPIEIIAIGCRIVPLDEKEQNQFKEGKSLSPNQQRTNDRSVRRQLDRTADRKFKLSSLLRELKMMPTQDMLTKMPLIELWQLRSKAATKGEKLGIEEFGRVLYHLNQRRGPKYRIDDDEKTKEYKSEILNRHRFIRDSQMTVGQYFYEELKKSECVNRDGKSFYRYRVKDNIFPRGAYEDEFMRIIETQMEFYPDLLNVQNIARLYHAIFFQRDLKSCKHLVSICEKERRLYHDMKNPAKTFYAGPNVAPKSSPLFQMFKVWQSVNNISFTDKNGDRLFISNSVKSALYQYLIDNNKLNVSDCYKIAGVNKKQFTLDKASIKGLSGNTTLTILKEALSPLPKEDIDSLTCFDVHFHKFVDKKTGEISQVIGDEIYNEQLYRLWHTIYSVNKEQDRRNCLKNNFGITNENVLESLCAINFKTQGYCKLSSKAIKKILPYLMEGSDYAEACSLAGLQHSDSMTKEENEKRVLTSELPMIKKNELRQPVVEKVLNQMIGVVNELKKKYGEIDEIRVELARELKQSRVERENATEQNKRNNLNNERIAKIIKKEYELDATRRQIFKYKLAEETKFRCAYCNKEIDVRGFLLGEYTEREHIIPKSILFDDSFANSVCSCSTCNKAKGNMTAFDYMRLQDEKAFEDYKIRVKSMYDRSSNPISKTKYRHLLVSYQDYLNRKSNGCVTEEDKEIWEHFIERQLRQTQYISAHALSMLKKICRNVYASSGAVTGFLRQEWGYNEILHTLNLPVYALSESGLTENVRVKINGKETDLHRIKDWSKRMDNRHHAIDALVVACTNQIFVQRLNELNKYRSALQQEVDESVKKKFAKKKSMLQKWAIINTPFAVKEVEKKVGGILVSYKSSGKVSTISKKNVQKTADCKGVITPHGALHERHIYGKVRINGQETTVYRYAIKDVLPQKLDEKSPDKTINKIKCGLDSIVDKQIKNLLLARINDGIDSVNTEKQPYEANVTKAIQNILDMNTNPAVQKDGTIIKRVRCRVSTPVIPVRYDENGNATGYAVVGNNHHVEFYKDSKDCIRQIVISFWNTIQRVRCGLNLSIKNVAKDLGHYRQYSERYDIGDLPKEEWKFCMCLQKNDMVLLGLTQKKVENAISANNMSLLAKHLYRVTGVSNDDYVFCKHTEPKKDTKDINKSDKRFVRIRKPENLFDALPIRVKISVIGDIKLL